MQFKILPIGRIQGECPRAYHIRKAQGCFPCIFLFEKFQITFLHFPIRKTIKFSRIRILTQFLFHPIFLFTFPEGKNTVKFQSYSKSKILTVIFAFFLDSPFGKKLVCLQCTCYQIDLPYHFGHIAMCMYCMRFEFFFVRAIEIRQRIVKLVTVWWPALSVSIDVATPLLGEEHIIMILRYRLR